MNANTFSSNPLLVTAWIFFGNKAVIRLNVVSIRFFQ